MDKYDRVQFETNKLLRLLSYNNAPDWFQKECRSEVAYILKPEWIERANVIEYNNGCFVGSTDEDGDESGEGIYMYDNGDIYLGSYIEGRRHGEGFYYYASRNLIYYGGWDADDKHGHGYVWGPGYESQGYYKNGKEIRRDFVRNGSNYSSNTSVSEEEGKGCGCLILIAIAVIWWIFF